MSKDMAKSLWEQYSDWSAQNPEIGIGAGAVLGGAVDTLAMPLKFGAMGMAKTISQGADLIGRPLSMPSQEWQDNISGYFDEGKYLPEGIRGFKNYAQGEQPVASTVGEYGVPGLGVVKGAKDAYKAQKSYNKYIRGEKIRMDKVRRDRGQTGYSRTPPKKDTGIDWNDPEVLKELFGKQNLSPEEYLESVQYLGNTVAAGSALYGSYKLREAEKNK